jgi:hypothetical protein
MIQFVCSIHILLQSFYIFAWLLRKLSVHTVTVDMTLDLKDKNFIPGRAVQFVFSRSQECSRAHLASLANGFVENLIIQVFIKF